LFALSVNGQSSAEISANELIVPGHAHNDYLSKDPLHTALGLGFKSIEVDVHLIKDELYVSHLRPLRLDAEKTLEEMYLKPLSKAKFIQAPLFLMIDVKTEAEITYQKLAEVLANYNLANVKYVISGNRAIQQIMDHPKNNMVLDGRPSDLEDRDIASSKMPVVSENYKKFFSSKKTSKISADELDRFSKFVHQAHNKDMLVRLWASPDRPEMWDFLKSLGVDLINTDRPKDLCEHLQRS